EGADLFFDLLGADARIDHPNPLALPAPAGRSGLKATVVAEQPLHFLVKREGDAAADALRGIAAVAAEKRRGKAAPVDKEEGLLPERKALFDRGEKRLRQKRTDPLCFFFQVDQLNRRQRPRIDPGGEREEAILSGPAVVERFKRRGGRAQNHHGIRLLAPDQGDVPRMVADPVFLLVGGVLLLIDDDHPDLFKRSKNSRPDADRQQRLPLLDPAPFVVALSRREPAVKEGDGIAETAVETGHQLRGQPDLRNEKNRPLFL